MTVLKNGFETLPRPDMQNRGNNEKGEKETSNLLVKVNSDDSSRRDSQASWASTAARGETGMMDAIAALITAAIGSGIVVIPKSVATSGWLAGVGAGIVMNGLGAMVAGICLSKAAFYAEKVAKRRVESFGEIAEITMGKWGKYVFGVCYHIILFSLGTIYMLLMGMSLRTCYDSIRTINDGKYIYPNFGFDWLGTSSDPTHATSPREDRYLSNWAKYTSDTDGYYNTYNVDPTYTKQYKKDDIPQFDAITGVYGADALPKVPNTNPQEYLVSYGTEKFIRDWTDPAVLTFVLIIFGVMILINQLKLGWLAKLSMVAVGACVGTLVIMIIAPMLMKVPEGVVSTDVSSWWPVEVYSGDEPLTDLTGWTAFGDWNGKGDQYKRTAGAGTAIWIVLEKMSGIFFGFAYTMVVPSVQNVMIEPKKMITCVPIAVSIVTVIYTAIAICSVIALSPDALYLGTDLYSSMMNVAKMHKAEWDKNSADILLRDLYYDQLKKGSWVILILAGTILINLMISSPLVMAPSCKAFTELMQGWFGAKLKDKDSADDDTTSDSDLENGADATEAAKSKGAAKEEEKFSWLNALSRTLIVTVTFLVVVAFGCKRRALDQLVDLVGAILDTIILMAFPMIAYQILRSRAGFKKTAWYIPEMVMHGWFCLICVAVLVISCISGIPNLYRIVSGTGKL